MDATATPAPGISGAPEDFATPYNRRRSFLLSLVHSTTRPRMTIPTPHPHTRVGPTPRPRAHPLSQAWTSSPSQLSPSPRSNPTSSSSPSTHDRMSFISTASSHDLTVHPRVNASFDPTTGAKGVGRFDAVKLNTYLHGLNRRLQEENETLVSRLRVHGEEVELGKVADELETDGFQGIEEAVLEEVAAMRDELDKCELEKRAFKTATDALVESLHREMDEVICERDTEREERKKDKERWKDRMAEVERGVEGVIKELERRLEEAERNANSRLSAEENVRELEAKCLAIEDDLNVAKCRAEKAESALASSSDLGAEMKQAYEHAEAHKEEIRIIKERADQLERRLRDAEYKEKQIRASSEDQLAELDAELRQSLEAQQSAEARALELEEETKAANDRLEELQDELRTSQQQTSQLVADTEDIRDRLEKREVEIARAAEFARQMEDALEDSERKMIADEEELASLRTKAIRLERELETLRVHTHSIASPDKNDTVTRECTLHELDTDQLEAELDEAHRQIGRLNHLLSESPTRKAIDQAKDMRIELLEREKDQLTERVRALTTLPSSGVNRSEQSPLPHRQVLVSRTPKTPGPPLKDYSWLHDTYVLPKASPLVAQIEQLQQELHLANDSIDEKVNMLEEAGMGIVGLTEKFEDARTQIIVLEAEVTRLVRREERQVRRLGRARCLKCGGHVDLGKLTSISSEEQSSEASSISMMLNPKSPPAKTAENLRLSLQAMNSQLNTLRLQWESEQKQIVGQNVVLQDAANRLNAELGAVRGEAKQALENGRQEISEEARARTSANIVVSNLEETLKDERDRLRALSMEQNRLVREKEDISARLQRAQSDMDDVRRQLEKVKRDNRELEAELRATEGVDQKARLLESKVLENQDVIENLRNERDSLAADQATLQRRYVEASAQVNRLRQELSTSQSSHEERCHQLDLRVNEIEDLRRELSEQARELERVESEKNQARADRSGIVRSVASLELDLKRVRSDAEVLGRDLRDLRTERDRSETRHRDELGKADRAQKQVCAQLRLANEQLEVQREKTRKAIAEVDNHVCESNGQDLDELRTQHKNECKGLMVQIRYLKAKFTRENAFRADLTYQKHYLLDILSTFEKSEKRILAAVARIGFPVSTSRPVRKRHTLRSIAAAVLFIGRAKRASEVWREQSSTKTAVQAALLEVRRRRVGGSLGYT
ncbi:hypothetical protein JB92DRAFT_2698552 [Gautieria morchelliformis]|nr:hypothetical protein JB92DRAFT_2698552 [Gautieria morchelliformis]